MIATLAAQTLRSRVRSILIWSGALCALTIMMVAIYPSIGRIDLEQLLKSYPKEFMQASGIESERQFSTPIGYLNGELFSVMIPLAIVFLPLGIVNQCMPAAEERHYLDNLLCTPIARWQVVAAAAVAGAIALAVVLVVVFAITMLAAELIGVDLGAADMARSCLALWPLASFFASIGVLVASSGPGRGRTLGAAGGLLVLMYMLPVIAAFANSFAQIQKISVFYYYNDWIQHGIDWPRFLLVLAVSAALTATGGVLFERRDVAS
ncbi:MAG: ABC transporter permease subunit [Thermoleophilia bacterium]|nr:ABC transporter permease subunit [Thermoleophilia bacterium]